MVIVRKLSNMANSYGLVLLAFLLRHKAIRRSLQAMGRGLGFARPNLGVDVDGGHWNTQTRRHEELVRFIESCGLAREARILDVGCGPGWLLSRLQRAGFTNLQGCDWLEQSSCEFPYTRVDLNAEGLSQFGDRSFDVAIISDVIEHLENPASMLRELRRVIPPDGHLFITIPNCASIAERVNFLFTGNSTRYRSERVAGPQSHISMLTSDIFESLYDRAGLTLLETRGAYCYAYGHFWGEMRHPSLSYVLMYHLVRAVAAPQRVVGAKGQAAARGLLEGQPRGTGGERSAGGRVG